MRKPDWPAMVGSSSKVKVVKVAPIEKWQLLQAGTRRQLEARVDERGGGEERNGRVSGAGEAVRARAVGGRLDVVPLGPLVGPVHCEGEKGACERARRGRGGASEGNALLMKSDAERNLALRLGWGPVVVSKRSLGRLAGLTFDIVERERGEGRRGGGGGEGSRWELVGSAGAWRWLVRVLCAVQLWTRRARVRCRSTSSSSSLLSLLLPTLALHQCRHPCSSFRQAGQSARETPTRSSPSQVAGPSPLSPSSSSSSSLTPCPPRRAASSTSRRRTASSTSTTRTSTPSTPLPSVSLPTPARRSPFPSLPAPSSIVDDLIIFPGDATFDQATPDRVHVLKFLSSSARHFYWAQKPDLAPDEFVQQRRRVNELIGADTPDEGADTGAMDVEA